MNSPYLTTWLPSLNTYTINFGIKYSFDGNYQSRQEMLREIDFPELFETNPRIMIHEYKSVSFNLFSVNNGNKSPFWTCPCSNLRFSAGVFAGPTVSLFTEAITTKAKIDDESWDRQIEKESFFISLENIALNRKNSGRWKTSVFDLRISGWGCC